MTSARGVARAAVATAAVLVVVLGSAPPVLADRIRDHQWYLKTLRIAAAHKMSKGAGVVVAVVDSGVWRGHPDLKGALVPGTDLIDGGAGSSGDIRGHGTAMAGIIAGRGHGSGDGVLGIAPAARIMPIGPAETTRLTIRAIEWATEHGAKVINLSIGVPESPGLEAAVQAAAAADVVLVAAAGNNDRPNAVEYPAGYPEVIAVGAVDRTGRLATFSQRGPQLDLVAPGVDDPTLDLDGGSGYATTSGTSDAAAMVSGAAALIRARHPDLKAADVVRRLTSTAVDRGAKGRDDAYGHGMLDVVAALTAPDPTTGPSVTPPAATPPAAAAPDSGRRTAGAGDSGGIPPAVIFGAGVALLLAAGLLGAVLIRRSRST